jgi:hypothetical protein
MLPQSRHLSPEDAGNLDGHINGSGSTRLIQKTLARARRRRASFLTWLCPARRRYLDALIVRLVHELCERGK